MNNPVFSLNRLLDTSENRAAIQIIFDATPKYFLATEGRIAQANASADEFTVLPPGMHDDDKFFYGIYVGDELIGCADVLRGFRFANKATLGLLLLRESHQGKGYGAKVYAMLEEIMKSWPHIDTIRLGVVENYGDALTFWRKMGFIETGERKIDAQYIADVIVLEKYLTVVPAQAGT